MENINNKEELLKIIGGGINLSGAILNAFKGCATTIMDIGRNLGSAIRRIYDGSLCKI